MTGQKPVADPLTLIKHVLVWFPHIWVSCTSHQVGLTLTHSLIVSNLQDEVRSLFCSFFVIFIFDIIVCGSPSTLSTLQTDLSVPLLLSAMIACRFSFVKCFSLQMLTQLLAMLNMYRKCVTCICCYWLHCTDYHILHLSLWQYVSHCPAFSISNFDLLLIPVVCILNLHRMWVAPSSFITVPV